LRRWPGPRAIGTWTLTLTVASVWLVHGLYNKVLHGSPRHLAIVQSVPGLSGTAGEHVLLAVGVLEIGIAAWVLSGAFAHACAALQTVVLLSMNAVELSFARELLLWPAGLVPANLAFLALAWAAAESRQPGLLMRLRRHPIPIEARLRDCITLTYALPAPVLRRLLPPGLELETFRGYGFVAIALVEARSLRPAGLPRCFGQDFFLAGYRVFARLRVTDGRTLRGLRILRSDANRRAMVAGGNLLTHYNYHLCSAALSSSSGQAHVSVRTGDGAGDLDVTIDPANSTLPAHSPFASIREARRFAGPLPFTFDDEPETDGTIAIRATRGCWHPVPVGADVRRAAFFDDPAFAGCTPILAAAFQVTEVDYRWERGERFPVVEPREGAR
jgi:uncharacterized membrane protein YphA (DoxX/SURF4 family)/uncharacterized protein YqjF (DUF2071 family)